MTVDFGLFYFANDSGETTKERYELLLEGARFADAHGFRSVWTPERHFHPFGGGYPNPSVTGAAVAAITKNVRIRAGSVVAPLHHPLRIAEEWSVVDNLSGGRAGVSFASGWHALDFSLNPDAYADRRSVVLERAEQVRRLWRGEHMTCVDGLGNSAEVRVFPPPVQPELPMWLTSSGSIETFRSAGRAGMGLLTHLLGQDVDRLADGLAEYRTAAAAYGREGWTGHVVLMVHTYLGEDDEACREAARAPLTAYMRSSFRLILGSKDLGTDETDPGALGPDEIDYLVNRSFDRYFDSDGMLGSVEKARRAVARFQDLGVDEVACLIDFGLPAESVLSGLTHLNRVREWSENDTRARAVPVGG
jgi:natural product biosynthesis luciferase-like monooxygenase protein